MIRVQYYDVFGKNCYDGSKLQEFEKKHKGVWLGIPYTISSIYIYATDVGTFVNCIAFENVEYGAIGRYLWGPVITKLLGTIIPHKKSNRIQCYLSNYTNRLYKDERFCDVANIQKHMVPPNSIVV